MTADNRTGRRAAEVVTRNATLAVLAIVLTGIGTRANAQVTRTRDSAGISIVDNPSRVQHPVNLRVSARAAFDAGGLQDNPDDEFNSREGYLRGVPLTRGGLAVIDVTRIHYFDPSARPMRIVGRKGAGPADFGYLTAICRTRGDTVVVSDNRNHRVAILGPSGAVVRTVPIADLGYPTLDACFADGTFVLAAARPAAPGARQTMRLSRVRLDGSRANVIADIYAKPWDPVTLGDVSIVAAGAKLYVGTGESSEVRVYTPAGKLIQIIRSDDPSSVITEAEADQRLANTVHIAPTRPRAARVATAPRGSHARTWPAYARMHVDPAGRLWVEDYHKDYPAPDGWSVFDPAGKLIGRLVLPAAAKGEIAPEVIGFGDNTILLRRADQDGAAHLTAYGIIGLGPARP